MGGQMMGTITRSPTPMPMPMPTRQCSLVRAIPSIVAMIVVATVLLFIQAIFADLVAMPLLVGWLIYMWAGIALMAVKLIIAVVPRLRNAVPRGLSRKLGQISAMLSCIGIVASPWILMPRADDVLSLLMIVLCMWFTAMVIILNSDRWSVAGAVAVVLSMALFTLVYRLSYALPVAGFLVMEAIALVMLRRMIWRSNEALAAALELTKSERDAKTRFIAAASHDLLQPIQAARLYFDQVVDSTDRDHRHRAITGATAAFSSIQALLEGMLGHLRLEAGATPVRLAPLKLAPALHATACEHEPVAKAAGLKIRVIGGDDHEVLADRDLLARVLSNLIANAVRHSHGRRLLLASRRRGSIAEIWAIDDGVGVAASDADRLFEDYFQSASGASRAGGFGLGLASARRMAELMNGSITLDGRWHAGCAFVVRLPIAPDPIR